MSPIGSHKDLVVWRKALAPANRVYDVTKTFPKAEQFGLAQQMRRASVSIASNIAEGSARKHRAEFVQFLHIARGSLAELETQLLIAEQQGFVASIESLTAEITEVGRLLTGLIRSLEKAT